MADPRTAVASTRNGPGEPPRIRDPSLFLSVYLHRHLPGFLEQDPRLIVLRQLDLFAERHALEPATGDWRHASAAAIDLVALDRSPPALQRLFDAARNTPDEIFRAMAYAHKDALVVQLVLGRFDERASLTNGWTELSSTLVESFDGRELAAAAPGVFGASVVYWAMGHNGRPGHLAGTFAAQVEEIIGTGTRFTETDIGPLWRSEVPVFPDARTVAQDRWVLISDDSGEAERVANRRYNVLRGDRPPHFAVVALARHKVAFERAQYAPRHEQLHQVRRRLDRRSRWIVEAERDLGARLDQLDTRESREFQEKLARAHTNLAEYQHEAAKVDELANTVQINQANFLVNAVALVSQDEADCVATSPRHADAARRALARWRERHTEEIFGAELGQMQILRDQLDADTRYAELLIGRQTASLASGGERLRIAEHREIAEIGEYHGVEAAAVVASVAAIVTLELLRLDQTLEHEPVLSGNLILFAVTGSFAAVQTLARRGRVKTWLWRASVAVAGGFAAGALGALLWGEIALAVNAPLVISAALAALAAVLAIEERARRRRRRKEDRAPSDPAIVKLVYATEELPELLEDMPPTDLHRVKTDASTREKIESRAAQRASERGITVEELVARGEEYGIVDIGDSIGVRYVVAPTRVPEVVRRVIQVAHAAEPDYKTVSTRIERGRYRGFRMRYRSVHIDLDLWGVGARKDVDLRAEVQVRTWIQDLFPRWFHDVMYKELEGASAPRLVRFLHRRAPPLNRALARLLIWLSDVEFVLFRGVMDWRDGGRS